MHYTTADGWVLELARIDRRALDALVTAPPSPPVRETATWGGVIEAVPVYDDPAYQQALFDHYTALQRQQLRVLAIGVALPEHYRTEAAALRELLPEPDTSAAALTLRYLLTDADRAAVIARVLYLSTVTERGISEAITRLAYTWRGKPLDTWGVGLSHGSRGQLAVDFRAAVRSGLTWGAFCELPGPEQSMHVAYWALEDRLSYLLQKG